MRYTIGRDRGCDIPVLDDSVSRKHAEITLAADGRIVLRDCGSSNGTMLLRDGARKSLQEEQVLPTDMVRFGGVEVSVQDILDAINAIHPEPAPTPQPAHDAKLIRCVCGAMKRPDEYCGECGQAPGASDVKIPEPAPPLEPAQDPKLIRCVCGAMKRLDEYCGECGQAPVAPDGINADSPQPVHDPKLIRCVCGAMKRSDEYCTECGQGPSA